MCQVSHIKPMLAAKARAVLPCLLRCPGWFPGTHWAVRTAGAAARCGRLFRVAAAGRWRRRWHVGIVCACATSATAERAWRRAGQQTLEVRERCAGELLNAGGFRFAMAVRVC